MDPITALGLGAAFLTSVAFVPQVVRNFRRKHVDDLSFSTFGTFTLGVVPLAIASGAGSGAQNAIGIGVIGGVVAGTLTLVDREPRLPPLSRRLVLP